MNHPSRDPGEAIKRELRTEVNFGCPVRFADGSGCGSPILTYHHFDPPWAGNYVHRPEGMIALCPQHHHQADGGLWSVAQLRAFKKSPFVDDSIKVRWPWQPERLVMKVGPSLVIGRGSAMRLDGMPIMHFQPVDIEALAIRTVQFDSEVRTQDGKPWMRIDQSWFDLELSGTTDLVFTPQTKTFIATHAESTFLKMCFRKITVEEYADWLPKFMSNPEIAASAVQSSIKVGAVDEEGNVSVVELGGHFQSRRVEVIIDGNRMKFRSFVAGLEDEFEWHSWVVDSERRVVLQLDEGPEFFSLG